MILQYFTKKENKERVIAEKIYKKILAESTSFLKKNDFFISKDFNSSFEIVSMILIMHFEFNISKKIHNYKVINEILLKLFISDLDETLRIKGIADTSIGKYVKAYVKKFYFRLSKFPKNNKIDNGEEVINYLKYFNLISPNNYLEASIKIQAIHRNIYEK
tara:strand:+ start:227 stop:709 length:483 start_codon:yes stop_codon:yes gene_type:complete